MANFLKSLLIASEKAANIARVCRSEKELFKLLVEEKTGEEGNTSRFVQDFKTLADVLVQETIRRDLIKEFPELAGHIRGEESNTFSNTLDQSIKVEIKDSPAETSELLSRVLDGDTHAAELISNEVHREINFDCINSDCTTIPDDLTLDLTNAGIWIDPIDSTSEYIHGDKSSNGEDEVHESGLQCVTVLIGIFDRTTGIPFVGVINQPFHKTEDDIIWHGKCYWGVQTDEINLTSQRLPNQLSNKIVLSRAESSAIQQKLVKNNAFSTVSAAGAGYKMLTVICGIVDAYLISGASIYNWDTCGPHAILKAMGGSVIRFNDIVTTQKVTELLYIKDFEVESKNIKIWQHSDGLIAYRSLETLAKLMNTLTSC